MYARDYKTFHPGGYYHIFNRGDNKEPIFIDEQDYINFLKRLKLALGLELPKVTLGIDQGSPLIQRRALRITPVPKNTFTILCYCLMPNHYHFLIQQNGKVNINKLIAKVCTSYVGYFNRKYKRIGNLFQDTFKAKEILDDSYLTYLSAYIHNNPMNPITYPYSSFPDYVNVREEKICGTDFILNYFNGNREQYKNFVLEFSEEKTQIIKDVLFDD